MKKRTTKKRTTVIYVLTGLLLISLLSINGYGLDCKEYQNKCRTFRDAKWFGSRLMMAQYQGTQNYNTDITSLAKCCVQEGGVQYSYYPVSGDDGYKCPFCLIIAAETGSKESSDEKALPAKEPPAENNLTSACIETLTGSLGGTTTSKKGKRVAFEAYDEGTRVKIGEGLSKVYTIPGHEGSFNDIDNALENGAGTKICVSVTGTIQTKWKPGQRPVAPKPAEGAKMKGGCRLDITFALGEPRAESEPIPSKSTVEEYAKKVKEMNVPTVYIYGFASIELFKGKGVEDSKKLNEELSRKRSEAAALILSSAGVSTSVAGKGQIVLFSDDFAPNRRVVMVTESLGADLDFIPAPSPGSISGDCTPKPKKNETTQNESTRNETMQNKTMRKETTLPVDEEALRKVFNRANAKYAECLKLEAQGKLVQAAFACNEAAEIANEILKKSQ